MSHIAIVLVGGRGTRLGALTEQTPKPLLPVAGRPFIFHVLDYLVQQGIKQVVLATGHLADAFEQAVGRQYRGIAIAYSREDTPLGTGGAIALALRQVNAPAAYVLNGDTYFPADLRSLAAIHDRQRAALSVVLRQVPDVSRYGQITTSQDVVTAMQEKGGSGPGLINGGIYLMNRSALLEAAPTGPFSLERELLPGWIQQRKVAGCVSDAYFIDIGIPADLQRAQSDLAQSRSATRKALFLDRDGTLIEHKPYLHRPEDVVLLPGTADALRLAQAAGYLLFLFTNQSGIGRGYFTLDDVDQVNRRLLELIGLGPNLFTEICIAPEHPDQQSEYRKPSPRFINKMIQRYDLQPEQCWMVGDTVSDWEAGLAANISVAAVQSSLATDAPGGEAARGSIPMMDSLLSFVQSNLYRNRVVR